MSVTNSIFIVGAGASWTSWLFFVATILILHSVVQRLRRLRHLHALAKLRDISFESAPQLPWDDRFLGLGLLVKQAIAASNKKLLDTFQQRFDEHGFTWTTNVLGSQFISTIEPENIKAVLSVNFADYSVAANRERGFAPFTGLGGIFTSDGPQWEHSRALLRPSFSRTSISDLPATERHVQRLLELFPNDRHTTIDIQKLFFDFTLDTATEFLVGQSVDALTTQTSEHNKAFAEAFEDAQEEMMLRFILGPLVCLRYSRRFDEACRISRAFVDKFVTDALNRREAVIDKPHTSKEESRYIFLDEVAKETQDPDQLRTAALNILLAGRDTTGSLLSNAFFLFSQHPEVWDKLRAEVACLEGQPPTYDQLRGFTYLRHALNEALRLLPPIPANLRVAMRDTWLPTGGGPSGRSPIFVARGDAVSYVVNSMHQRKDIFGEDAEEFRPERWQHLSPGWGFLPFNGGPRICLGQQYSLTSAMYTVARMAQTVRRLEYRGNGWVEGLRIGYYNAEGVPVTIQKVDNGE